MKRSVYISVLLLVAFLLSAGGMIHFYSRAVHYEQQWVDAMEQLATVNASRSRLEQPGRPPAPRRDAGPLDLSDLHIEQDQLISDLLDELGRRDRQIAEIERSAGQPRRPPSPEERMQQLETLRENDPERYAEIIARQEAFRERLQESFAGRAAVLGEVDTRSMSQAELRQHRHLMETLQKTWDLTDRITSSDTPPEERREIREQLTEISRELRPMLDHERTRRLVELGISSGYSPDEAQVFSDYIRQTFEATSMQRLPGPRGGPTRPDR